MTTKPPLARPPLFQHIIESDRELDELMKEDAVPLRKTWDYLQRQKRLRREAEKIYFPSKKTTED